MRADELTNVRASGRRAASGRAGGRTDTLADGSGLMIGGYAGVEQGDNRCLLLLSYLVRLILYPSWRNTFSTNANLINLMTG